LLPTARKPYSKTGISRSAELLVSDLIFVIAALLLLHKLSKPAASTQDSTIAFIDTGVLLPVDCDACFSLEKIARDPKTIQESDKL
jgi:hypothetical protein